MNDGRMQRGENGINVFENEIEQHPCDPAQCESGEVDSQEKDQPVLRVAWQGQAHVDDLTGLPLPEGLCTAARKYLGEGIVDRWGNPRV